MFIPASMSFTVFYRSYILVTICNCAVPGQVRGFNVVNRTTTEMFVVWNPPSVTNGILTGYHITLAGIV